MFSVPRGMLRISWVCLDLGVPWGMFGIFWGMFGIPRAMNIMGYDCCSQGYVKNIMEHVQCSLGYVKNIMGLELS